MPPTLQIRLTDIRRRVRQALLAWGLGWLAAIGVGSLLTVCLADWLIHFDDAGVRLILGLSVLGGTGYAAYRFLVVPLRVSFSDVDLALRIEGRFPGFRDSLASSVQFLECGGDPRIGSPALQQAVVCDALARLDTLDCGDVLQTRQIRRIIVAALGVCLVAALVAGLDRTQTSIALRRLFVPFSAPGWPRQTNLRLLDSELRPLDPEADPLQIARGDVLKLYVENQTGKLPTRVDLEFEADAGKIVSEAMRPMTVGGSSGSARELAVGQVPAIKGEVRFRAVGGDDQDMPWHRLRAIPPPVVESLQVTLTPPSYAKREVERLPEGVGHVQGLVGTRIDVAATVSKPLRSAAIRIRDQQQDAVRISVDGRRLAASFVIAEAGIHSWWFDLKDADGFENADPTRYEVRGVLDTEPEIRIDLPASDVQATPDAELALKTIAHDDLGIAEIRLVFRAADDETARMTTIPLFGGDGRPHDQTVDAIWSLSSASLSEGMRIVFRTEATDDFDLSDVFPEGKSPPPHVGKSVSRLLTIVSREEKTRELAQRQTGLLDDLERAFQTQKRTHDQVGELRMQLENAERLRPADLDVLQRTEIGQREVAGQLTHPASGLARRARDLLEELHGNHLDDPQSERRLSEISGELERLGGDNLPRIEQELTQARKLLQTEAARRKPAAENPPGRNDKSTAATARAPQGGVESKSAPATADRESKQADRADAALGRVAENQEAVIESLSEMLQTLAQWRNEHDAARELGAMIRQQEDLNRRTAEIGRETLSKPRERLTPQQQADLAKFASGQKRQADQLEQLESRMRDKIGSLSESNPEAAASLKDALEQAREQGISEQMREAAGQIGENRMGDASRSQDQVLEKLRELERTLGESRDSDNEVLVKKLKLAERDMQDLRDREGELLRKVEQAEQLRDPARREAELRKLQREQQQIRDETAKMARRLERLAARRSSSSARRAADRMQRAQQELEQADQAGAAAEQREAIDDLEQAQRELARERRRAEEQLAREQLDKIAGELAAMIGRVDAALAETRRLDDLRQTDGRLSRAQLKALSDLTSVERQMKEDTDRLTEKLTAAEVFAQALRGAARSMQRAVELLEERDTGSETQLAQESARRRFVDLTAALAESDEDKPGREQAQREQQGGAQGENEAGPETDGIPALAELKMLLALQREIFERTSRLQELRETGKPLTTFQQLEFEALAREQRELADLARNLSRLASDPLDDDPPADEAHEPRGANPNRKSAR